MQTSKDVAKNTVPTDIHQQVLEALRHWSSVGGRQRRKEESRTADLAALRALLLEAGLDRVKRCMDWVVETQDRRNGEWWIGRLIALYPFYLQEHPDPPATRETPEDYGSHVVRDTEFLQRWADGWRPSSVVYRTSFVRVNPWDDWIPPAGARAPASTWISSLKKS